MGDPTAVVATLLATLDHPLHAVIVQVRALILSADNQITEHIKWKAPSFCYHGDDRVTMRLYPVEQIQLVFHRGVKVKDATTFAFADPGGRLRWQAADRATVTLQSVQEVDAQAAELAEVVRRWMYATV